MVFEKFDEVFPGFEEEDDVLVNTDYDIKLAKINEKIYAIREESEETEYEDGGRIYMLGTTWYMPFNIAQFLEDVELNNVDPDNFYIGDYEL